MNNIISLTGHKNSGKLSVEFDLAKNSAIEYVKPYTDRPSNEIWDDCYYFVSKGELDELICEKEVLYQTMVNGYRYVFFKDQLTADYNILILDDYGVAELQSKYRKYLYSVKVVSKKQRDSDRVGVYLYNHEFDEVFDYDTDDITDLEYRIESNFMWRE